MPADKGTTIGATRRNQVIAAAHAIATQNGWTAVTARAIAARVGCSAPAIYQYFQGKEEILRAVAGEGEQALIAALDTTLTTTKGSAKRLRAAVRALWDFAMANRALFALMYGGGGVAPHLGAELPAPFREAAARLVAKRGAAEPADDFAARIAAVVLGCLALAESDRLLGGPARALELCERLVEDAIRGLKRR